jgi:hypothetical protein
VNTFEVILYPNGRLNVQYLSMPSAPARLRSGSPGGESPVGVEGPDGTGGYVWAGPVRDQSAWLFRPYDSAGTNTLFAIDRVGLWSLQVSSELAARTCSKLT